MRTATQIRHVERTLAALEIGPVTAYTIISRGVPMRHVYPVLRRLERLGVVERRYTADNRLGVPRAWWSLCG